MPIETRGGPPERERVWREAFALADHAARENRAFTPGEQSEYERLSDRLDELDHRAEAARGTEATEAAFAKLGAAPAGGASAPPAAGDRDLDAAFRRCVLERDYRPIHATEPHPRSGYRPGIERRDLTTGSGGGLLPTSFYDRVVAHMTENSAILAAGATLLTSDSGEPLRVPRSTARSQAAIVTEGSAIPYSDPAIDTAALGSYKYAFLTSVTRELAEDSSFDLLGYLARQAGTALGNAFGEHAIVGSGAGEPDGLLPAASVGVTGGSAVPPTGDELIELYHSVASPYARSESAGWLMNNSTLAGVRKLKASGSGEYLFDLNYPPGSGAAGSLLGRPVFIDPNMPDVASGAKSVAFGDFSRYWVRQVNGIRWDRSDEFRFHEDVVVWRGVWRADGVLVDTTGAVKAYTSA